MRKVLALVVSLAVVAGAASWYAFSYLPQKFQGEVDTAIASLKPRFTITYENVDLSVFDRKAVFSDVVIRDDVANLSLSVKTLTSSAADDANAFDAMLTDAALSNTPQGEKFMAEAVRIDGLSIRPNAGNASSEPLDQLKRIALRKLIIRKITNSKADLNVENISLSDFRNASFKSAEISGVRIKPENDDVEFLASKITAADVDIGQIVTLPKTFRGQPDWSKLDTGKTSISEFRVSNPEFRFRVNEVLSDGIAAGRVTRFSIAGMALNGNLKGGDRPFEIALDKLEINNFPIITNFPKSAEEFQAFQARHKNLIYDGFDIEALSIKGDGGIFEIHRATVPKPTFRKTASGAEYAARAEIEIDLRTDLSNFSPPEKPMDPVIGQIFDGLSAQLKLSGLSIADHETKTQRIERLTINLANLARLEVSADIGNLPLRYFEAPNDPLVQQIALRQATIGALEISFINDGLAGRLLDIVAEKDGVTKQAVVQQMSRSIRALLTGDRSPESAEIANTLATFIADPKSLTLKMDPGKPVPAIALANPQALQSFGAISKVLGLKAIANDADTK